MLQVSYETWGFGIIGLLLAVWTIKRIIRRMRNADGRQSTHRPHIRDAGCHDIEHRALVFLMTQKTDALLAALARTIELERQKLGGIVRNPSIAGVVNTPQADVMPEPMNHPSPYDQILPMARNGAGAADIARQLDLPEAEVSMVMRLKAA
ncbi:MAG: hypothetical protein PVG51_09940 [Desulfosarcina sp.]|jgi:hypothetical protein